MPKRPREREGEGGRGGGGGQETGPVAVAMEVDVAVVDMTASQPSTPHLGPTAAELVLRAFEKVRRVEEVRGGPSSGLCALSHGAVCVQPGSQLPYSVRPLSTSLVRARMGPHTRTNASDR
jgi:hypothetical protein